MKVCYLLEQVYKSGGIERVVSHKLDYWSKIKDMDVYLITEEDFGRKPYYDFPLNVNKFDLNLSFNRQVSLTKLTNIFEAVKLFFKLMMLLKKIKPDVIILTTYGYAYFFLPFLCGSAKIIKEYHASNLFNTERKGFFSKVKGFFSDKFQSLYDKHVFLSAEEASASGIVNAVVIPNPIAKIINEKSINRSNYVIAAGRIAPVKGFERLINIWSLVFMQVKDWELHIYGDGEEGYVNGLRDIIKSHNLEHSIKIYPSTPHIHQKMLASKVYAMTSLTECFPMVLLEAIQLGLPIIAFDCPTGPRNIIKSEKMGILIPDDDLNSFADNLLLLIHSDELRESLVSNAMSLMGQYDVDSIMQSWDNLLRDVVKDDSTA